MANLDDLINEKKQEQIEEKLEKQYSLNLGQIEIIKVSGKEYFKFYDASTDTIRMIENISNLSMREQFLYLQNNLNHAQAKDGTLNAQNIFNHEAKFNKHEIKLVSISYIQNHYSEFQQIYNGMNAYQKLAYDFLVKNAKDLKIKYINIEESLIVNENQIVSHIHYDEQHKKLVSEQAEVQKYENNKVNVDEDNYVLEMDGINFDEVVEGISIDVPSEDAITISGEVITIAELKQFYYYPELLENKDIVTPKKRTIIQYLIAAYSKKKEKQNTKVKVLVLKKPTNAAFTNTILLSLICSFVSGIIFTICFIYIKLKI